ncbi:SagB/ThcOx family dehydrogenase [Candidatus Sumerlaeota bacterium]|nr:SagB/ThcOx family dehydrogenase [Candidatus Sumerlaeota bacterium]
MATDFPSSQFYRYHQATKHTRARVYAGGWHLDWANQPDPFRRYDGVPVVRLPPPQRPEGGDLFHSPSGKPASKPLTLGDLSTLLCHSMAISAWKQIPGTDVRWALRVNPSSGNLHPTETHLILSGVEGIDDGIYHFRVDTFTLEARFQDDVTGVIRAISRIAGLRCGAVTFLLTSILWREAWKYRDRAFRYCHHDLGHALGAIATMLQGLGHTPRVAHLFDDRKLMRWTGLSETDERPGILITFGEPCAGEGEEGEPPECRGEPNQLSPEVIEYRSIEEVWEATSTLTLSTSPEAGCHSETRGLHQAIPLAREGVARRGLWEAIRTRRSGIAFDGKTGCTLEDLGLMLHSATEGLDCDIHSFRRGSGGLFHVHLFVWAHRVEGLPAGCWAYDRTAHALQPIIPGDVRGLAASLSLDQAIAGDSAFAISMVADLGRAHTRFGERAYRAVHIEAGHIGQGLYLGAESLGLQATGIGAFFDNEVNQVLGLSEGLEVIYHFTVGGALPDRRVRQLASYDFDRG